MKHVVVFPEDGTTVRGASDPNNWHLTTQELERQIEAKGWKMHAYPDEVAGVDPKDRNTLAIYNGISTQYQPPIIERSLLIINEPPIVKPRLYERLHGWPVRRVLTFSHELVDDKRVFFSPFPVPSYSKDLSGVVRDKYICAITSGGKSFPGGLYEDRRQAYMGWGKDLDLYGWGWEKDAEMLDKVNYCGPVDDKVAVLARYRYAIVFENQIVHGYNSEKLYHCLQAGTVPLYRGSKRDVLPLGEVTEEPWARRIVAHLEAICD